jgi:dTDP-glucose 4,6-dehydratase
MRLVITGAAGFIGSRFTEMALEDAERLGFNELVLVDALTYSGRRENLLEVLKDSRVNFVEGSINDPSVTDAVCRGAHAVAHLAAESHVDRSIESAQPFFTTNVLGTQQLLESARRSEVQRFLHVSTDEVYGSIDVGSWREDHVLEPNSPYSASKAAGDLAALAYHSTYGLSVSVTRCTNNYGPRQFPEKLIPLFVTNLIDARRVPLYGDGLNVRDWLHVDDHCRALLAVLERGRAGEIYNIGGGTALTNRELADRLFNLMGASTDAIEFVPDRLGHDRRYCVDDTKVRNELGYEPRVKFDEGLRATVQWYRDNEWWWRPMVQR